MGRSSCAAALSLNQPPLPLFGGSGSSSTLVTEDVSPDLFFILSKKEEPDEVSDTGELA
ncbi:hypothetical protein HETIRDRAFT_407819 [Heterobasidion irregulare TC 32-1]|uniref:Uncharacterized protein n=1 Tax=Heterobasidion irregulare (strain TC 32-1) TaxID=747525 RepID=W4KK04_HETIT|nr:uncharacterized protein HETIRDRAFT_407819 [Heterobasidion irregulare TC 32-1]ETW86034.1 hypothetical protein HETIRDRAFT_407819 [Heterobasidion irregulare TC 32-1]